MEQIGALNSNKNSPLANSIAKNFDNLRHSLVKQSKITKKEVRERKVGEDGVKGNLKALRREVGQLRDTAKEEFKNVFEDMA